MNKNKKYTGFTIVELLIVIVVIGILAAITIVAFNGIQERARATAASSALEQISKKITLWHVENSAYPTPANLAAVGVVDTPTISYLYTVDNTASPQSYCVTATTGTTSYFVNNTNTPLVGTCALNNGLIGWWKLNGNATDATGNGNNGTVSGPTSAAGQNSQANSAYQFSSGGISFPSGYAVSALTKSAWVFVSAGTGGYATIFDFGATPGSIYMEMLNTGTGPMVGASVTPGTGNAFTGAVNQVSGTTSFNQWHHIVQTVTTTNMSLYVNGALASSLAGTYDLTRATIAPTVGYGRAQFIGSIDDVRFYNRALSLSDVQSLYSAGAQ